MRSVFACIVAALLSAAIAQPVAAQFDSSLAGVRVRAHVRDVHRQASMVPAQLELRGTVIEGDSSRLVLRLPGTVSDVTVPRAEVVRLWVSRGVPSRPESAVRGLVGGAVAGAVWGLAYHAGPLRTREHRWEDAALGGAAVGGIIGGVFGAISPHERWKRVRLP